MTTTGPKMRIGEVHTLLRSEFPNIELSKIRYYEDKGLVRPGRSRKGYRLYSSADVACLREAFRLAQEEFVPLRVIRQRLIEQGLLTDEPIVTVARQAAKEAPANIVTMPVRHLTSVPPAPASPTRDDEDDHASPVGADASESGEQRYTTAQFLDAARLRDGELAQYIEFGFLRARDVAGQTVYDEQDLLVARRLRALCERGVDVRHLQSIKRTVDRQMDLLHDLTLPLRHSSSETMTCDVEKETRAVAEEIAELRDALVERATSAYFGH